MYEVAFKVKYFKVLWITVSKIEGTEFKVSGNGVLLVSFLMDLAMPRNEGLSSASVCAGRSAPAVPGDVTRLPCKVLPTSMLLEPDTVLSLIRATVKNRRLGTLSLRPPVTKVIEGISKNRLAANKLESGEQLQHSSSCLAATPNLRTLYVLSSATLRT